MGGQRGRPRVLLHPLSYAESLPGKQNDQCLTTVKSLRLEIIYLGKQDVFPH